MSPLLLALLGSAGVAGTLFLLVVAGGAALRGRRDHTEARLSALAGGDVPHSFIRAVEPSAPERGAELDRRLTALPLGARLKRDLRRAGVAWRVSDYVVVVACCAVTAGVLAGLGSRNLAAGIVAAGLGALAPVLLVRRRASSRAGLLNTQVGDLLDLLSSSMRAGFGFQQSLELAAREQPDPIAVELRQTLREMSLGMSTEEALERLVSRTGDADLELVIAAVLIQRRVGGNLASVLDNIAQMIRDRARVRGEIQTLTAQARLSGKIVGLLPIGLAGAIYLMQPDYMDPLFFEPVGRLLLVTAVLLEATGFYIVNRIGAIDY